MDPDATQPLVIDPKHYQTLRYIAQAMERHAIAAEKAADAAERQAIAAERQADIEEWKQQRLIDQDFKEQSIRVSELLSFIIACLPDGLPDLSNHKSVTETFAQVYARKDTREKIERARRQLRELLFAGAIKYSQANSKYPREGIFANPHYHIYGVLKAVVMVMVADQANFVHGMGKEWVSSAVDDKMHYIVDVIMPKLIKAQAQLPEEDVIIPELIEAQARLPEEEVKKLSSWLNTARLVIDAAADVSSSNNSSDSEE